MNDVNGLHVTSTTLVGYSKGKYPLKHGNCFSMKADDGHEYRIVNFVHENLEEAIRRDKCWSPRMHVSYVEGVEHYLEHLKRCKEDGKYREECLAQQTKS